MTQTGNSKARAIIFYSQRTMSSLLVLCMEVKQTPDKINKISDEPAFLIDEDKITGTLRFLYNALLGSRGMTSPQDIHQLSTLSGSFPTSPLEMSD